MTGFVILGIVILIFIFAIGMYNAIGPAQGADRQRLGGYRCATQTAL